VNCADGSGRGVPSAGRKAPREHAAHLLGHLRVDAKRRRGIAVGGPAQQPVERLLGGEQAAPRRGRASRSTYVVENPRKPKLSTAIARPTV
jgi:hypothetical protein